MQETKRELAKSSADKSAFEDVLELFRQCEPFLDPSGQSYCRIQAETARRSICHELRSKPVRDFIAYRYSVTHSGSIPNDRHITRAISYINGELWQNEIAKQPRLHLVTQLIVKMAEVSDGFVGTATEHYDKIVAQNGNSVAGLPPNPSSFGRLLGTLIIQCREVGIELFRPRRRANKRLWGWRKLTFCDANDTSVTPNPNADRDRNDVCLGITSVNDGSDALTEEQREILAVCNGETENVNDESE